MLRPCVQKDIEQLGLGAKFELRAPRVQVLWGHIHPELAESNHLRQGVLLQVAQEPGPWAAATSGGSDWGYSTAPHHGHARRVFHALPLGHPRQTRLGAGGRVMVLGTGGPDDVGDLDDREFGNSQSKGGGGMSELKCPCCNGSMTQYASDICGARVECDFCQFACCLEHLPSLRASRETYSALVHLHHNAKASGCEMGLALDVAESALKKARGES